MIIGEKEVAEMTGVTASQLRYYRRHGRGPETVPGTGHRVLYDVDVVRRWVTTRRKAQRDLLLTIADSTETYLTASAVCRLLGISPPTLRTMIEPPPKMDAKDCELYSRSELIGWATERFEQHGDTWLYRDGIPLIKKAKK